MIPKTVKPLLKRILPSAAIDLYRRREYEASLSESARNIRRRDREGLSAHDCGPSVAVRKTADWLCRAQDNALPRDGGVARHYSLNTGWSPSYPETTGYIVPTFLRLEERYPGHGFADRGCDMLDWLVSIQLESGAFQGGMITHEPVPVTFNTGQILIGLAAGAGQFEDKPYTEAMIRAAQWLRDTQDDDGCWRNYATPFAAPGEKAYETHVSWGLLEAERIAPDQGFGDAAMRQIDWAMGKIQPNGWISDCCLSDPANPLTHTLGYALRGLIEGYRYSKEQKYYHAAETVAEGLVGCIGADGRLPGRLDSLWRPSVRWVCLTGSVQIAASLFDLFIWSGDTRWRDSALALNRFVRRTLALEGNADLVGAVAGSFPIDGGYGQFEYLNWAAKFFIDANLMEMDIESLRDHATSVVER